MIKIIPILCKLLSKLQFYSISSNGHPWITSFLKGRTQTVVVDGSRSTSAQVISGVPLGTVLSPLLFLLHTNDLPLSVRSQVGLFADDCLLYRQIHSAEAQEVQQQDLRSLILAVGHQVGHAVQRIEM
jgi:hypothetical protein